MIQVDRVCVYLLTLLLAAVIPVFSDGPVKTDYVTAELVSENTSIRSSTPFWVGVRLEMKPLWHTYWVNPGDSGLETRIDWNLPVGFEAGPIHWPYPERIVMEPLVNFGYERAVMLLVKITPPENLETGQEVTLEAQVAWLVCKEICLPGEATVRRSLAVRDTPPEPDRGQAEAFTRARAEWPARDTGWSMEARMDEETIRLSLMPPEEYDALQGEPFFFPHHQELIKHAAPQHWRQVNSGYTLDVSRDTQFDHEPDRLTGALVVEHGWRGPDSERALAVDVPMERVDRLEPVTAAERIGADAGIGLLPAILFAFIGGLMLNLTPCVFPIISLKILGFVKQAGESRVMVAKHGLVFALGVLVLFWILAGALIALRAAGQQLGWGFQLQSPAFIVFITSLLFILALNLFGVFEVGMSWTGLDARVNTHSGLSGSFFTGALATIVATPCTAPFMGVALGYALTLSAAEALLIFTVLGIGMALPYVLLSIFPQWLQKLPKPGPWMVSFKQFMGFVLLAMVVGLIAVLGHQTGTVTVLHLLYGLFLMGLAAWLLGRWGELSRPIKTRVTARVVALVLIAVGLAYAWPDADAVHRAEGVETRPAGGMPWQEFSPERLEELRAEGQPVFINFTAAWCTSCQVNERIAFSNRRVIRRFDEMGIVPLKADWTLRDDTIATVLAGYGRSGVPTYVLYGHGRDREPVFLPELLTPGLVLDALERMPGPG